MTVRKLYGASFGPYEYDDTDTIDDIDSEWTGLLEHASITDGGHLCGFLDLFDTNESNHLKMYWNENDTVNRVIALTVNGGNRTFALHGNLTVEAASIINQDVTTDANVAFNSVKLAADEYANFGGVYGAGSYGLRDKSGVMEIKNSGGTWVPFGLESEKSWAFSSPQGGGATFYVGDFYSFASSDDDFAGGPTFGTANVSYAAHFFVVLGAVTVDELTITVSGDSIDDNGNRVNGTTENIVIPNSTAVDSYFETTKKWLGQVTITVASGTAKTCNYGYAKYWDSNNSKFTVTGLQATWLGGATDANFDILLFHHKATGWTFNAAAEPSPPTELASLATDHGAGDEIRADVNGAWKRVNLDTDVDGAGSEGIIIQAVTTSAKTIQSGTFLLRIKNLTA